MLWIRRGGAAGSRSAVRSGTGRCRGAASLLRNLDETLQKLSEELTQNKQKREEQDHFFGPCDIFS